MIPKHKRPSQTRAVSVALSGSALMLLAAMYAMDGITSAVILRRILWPLTRLMMFIGVGLAVGQIIEAAGWTKKIGILGAPLFRFARLGPHCSASFTTAFFSGEAANAMLYEFWKEGKIDRWQLILTNLANQLPAYFLHLPTTVFIVLPLTGLAGGLYFILTFIAAVLRFILVLIVGRHRSAQLPGDSIESEPTEASGQTKAGAWSALKQKLPRRLINVGIYVIPIYIAVFLLSGAGVFEWTQQWLAREVSTVFLPVEALSMVVLSFAAEFTSGFATAGALLKEGVLTTQQTVMALLIGNIVAFPIRALRHQLPRLLGIFAPKMGLQLLLLGQGMRILSIVMVGGIYCLL